MSDEPRGAVNGVRRSTVRGPDLYRGNIFRVTGLPVDATPQMIRRQRERFRVAFETGTPTPSATGPLALQPPPDRSAVETAFEGFRDLERRLVDELFWFWGAEAPRDAVSSSAADRYADHDRAVAAHCTALDLEDTGRQRALTPEERRRRDSCWSEATRRWAALDDMPQIWERLHHRVTEIDDPRLPADTVDDILDGLPIRLATIHAELALELGQHDTVDAQRQRKLIDQLVAAARLDTARVDAALRAAVAPALARIDTICETTRKAATREPAAGCAAGTRALGQLRPLVETVGIVLTSTNPTVRDARDHVASTLNNCAVAQGDITINANSLSPAALLPVLELVKEAAKFACHAPTADQIRDNIGNYTRSYEFRVSQAQSPGAVPPRAPSTPALPSGPRTGREIFAQLRSSKRGPWSYIDQLCREGRPNLAQDALALWGNYLARDPAAAKQINTLLAKPAPFVARMQRPPSRAMVWGCGIGSRSYQGEGTVGEGQAMAIQYLALFFIPLVHLGAYLITGNPPHAVRFVGKVPLGMDLRLRRKMLTLVIVITLTVIMFGGAFLVALLWILALRIGIYVCKTAVLWHNIRQSMTR
jgi:hypothetical protein